MTPERIAEIEELAATKAPMVYVRAGSIRELCRLARLGLRVEGAVEAVPSYVFNTDNAELLAVFRLPAAWASGPVLIIPKPEDKP